MAHGAASTHILGALARLEIADHLADGPRNLHLHLLVMSGGRERTRDQYRHLLDSAGWQLTGVTALPSGQSILSAGTRPGTGPAPG